MENRRARHKTVQIEPYGLPYATEEHLMICSPRGFTPILLIQGTETHSRPRAWSDP